MLTTPNLTPDLQLKLSELSLVCQSLLISPMKFPMTNFGLWFWKVPKQWTQWLLLVRSVTTTLLLATPMVSLRVCALPTPMEIANTKSSKWETHGDFLNILDHGLMIVTFGLQSGGNKLILLELMRVNSGYHLISGEHSMPQHSTLTTEMTGTKLPSKVTQQNSLQINKRMDLLVSTTQLNNMLLSIAFNGKTDSSHMVARTNILQITTVTFCWTTNTNRWILPHNRLCATVEQWNFNFQREHSRLESTPSEEEAVATTNKSGRWESSLEKSKLLTYNKQETHTNEIL